MIVVDKKKPITCKTKKTSRPSKDEALRAVETLIAWIGDNPVREGLIETPHRVIESYNEIFSGYHKDPHQVLSKTFAEIDNYDEMILVKDIRIESYCEHHMLPIIGIAHIAYIPTKKIVGLSKLARLADIFAKRLQTQEKLTVQIANSIDEVLQPLGTAVVIDATHQCMTMRGVHKSDSSTVTSKMTGLFNTNAELRKELFDRLK
jgi:GTP cyclohydrolase I